MTPLQILAATIESRRGADPDSSWTAKLLAKGPEKCAEKFGEEAIEAIIEAVKGDRDHLVSEAADALYHLLVMLAAIASFSLAITGIGLAISTVSQNQQQAFLGGFLVIVPMMLLSGYASPVDGMPQWLQLVSRIDPLSHMLTICHGLFLKGLPPALAWPHIWPMLSVALIALGAALGLLRLRSD